MVESIKFQGRPFGKYAGDEQGVFKVWAFLCIRYKMSLHHLFVAEISHIVDFFLRDVRIPLRSIDMRDSSPDCRISHGWLKSHKLIAHCCDHMGEACFMRGQFRTPGSLGSSNTSIGARFQGRSNYNLNAVFTGVGEFLGLSSLAARIAMRSKAAFCRVGS
jgi:hypothetical protein